MPVSSSRSMPLTSRYPPIFRAILGTHNRLRLLPATVRKYSSAKRKNAPESSDAFQKIIREKLIDLLTHGAARIGNVFRSHVEGQHESVRAFELIRLRAFSIGLKFIRHHDETIVPRRSPVPNVLEHRWIVGHALETLQLDLSSLAAVQRGMSLVLVKGPGVNVAFGGLE